MNAKAIDRLASALGRADEAPNVALARELAAAAWEELLLMLRGAAVNQIPMYAEAALAAAPMHDPAALAEVVRARLAGIANPQKRRGSRRCLGGWRRLRGRRGR